MDEKSISEDHREAMFDAMSAGLRGDFKPLIALLESEHQSIGRPVRTLLAALLSEDNNLGMTFRLVRHSSFSGNEKTPLQKAAKSNRDGNLYATFRQFRSLGETYESSLELTAEKHGVTPLTVKRARKSQRDTLLNAIRGYPDIVASLPEDYLERLF